MSPAVFCAPRGRPGAAAAAAGVLCVVPLLLELGPRLSWWLWCSGVAAPSASHALAGVCPSSWEQVNKGEGYDAAEELLKWSCRLCRKPLLMPLSVLLQAKDSDDDDEVTVSVDRDRFMDEFFEQVRALFLQGRFKASSDLSVKGGAGCGAVVQAPTAGGTQRSGGDGGPAQLTLRVLGGCTQSPDEQGPGFRADLGLSWAFLALGMFCCAGFSRNQWGS